jgi:hypothetical protein
VSSEPGEHWGWAKQQMQLPHKSNSICVRRKAWPVAYYRAGETYGDFKPKHDIQRVWHIWHTHDVGDQSSFVGGLCQGWGGQLGAAHDEDDCVMVCGKPTYDGTYYKPTTVDVLSDDWEFAFPDEISAIDWEESRK